MSGNVIQDKADQRAREESMKAIREIFLKLVEQIKNKEEPSLVIKKRTLSNTIYDPKRKLLLLGNQKLVRKLFDESEARTFMQTVLMARIIYEALKNNEYPTIRDLFYRGKHTLPYTSPRDRFKNTWEEQKESDAVLRDVEVLTNKLREEMLILSKEKGKVVGDMRLRSGNDIIDLSKMGHGAYAIESTPDLIEFVDYSADYVLVVEKDAVFQQLHRYGYWRKNKVILVTSAGQPDRATRRFVRRLNEELKLPVYILADSDPYGFYIYSVFKIGSITLSYESERLATPKARFLGVTMSDVFGDDVPLNEIYITPEESRIGNPEKLRREKKERFLKALKDLGYKGKLSKEPFMTSEERKNFIIRAKEQDLERAVELVGDKVYKAFAGEQLKTTRSGKKSVKKSPGYQWFQEPKWIKEIGIFFLTHSKLEIEAMASKGLKFLAEEYLPKKIETKDYLD
ncbi:MAG: DNA topoisomerase IV subunit A [Fervidicoccaceae archaeon]|jgi:DNA topoisomerase-6 subunit A|uniref:Type 2 DNA topoisomerase 6 subunit A n=1 Tax=Fervidicoccus fontis TaxID=683846 RepID=A0A7C2UQW5_9CREN|nr:MAG: DNA topoisomerase VI [Fervidicoccus sp.]HEU97316.1 DNA topoisomerase IV subunit A [Fervidicoccus fontis]